MAGIGGLWREIDEVQSKILAIECILRALDRLPEGSDWTSLEREVRCNVALVHKMSRVFSSAAKQQAFDHEIARLLGLLGRRGG